MLEDILKQWGGYEVSAMDVYSDIFRLGEGYIQAAGEYEGLKANPVGYYRNSSEDKGHFRILLEDTFEETLRELQEADSFAILNGITYFGRKNEQQHASKMYAMIFDLDGVEDNNLNNLLSGAINGGAYPIPNYIALSGHGIHLYYVFEEPVALFPYTKIQLKELKYALTEKIWNMYTSTIKKKQFQGINQGFRVIGGHTKIPGVRVRAFRVNEHPFSLRQLCEFVPEEHRIDEQQLFKESKYSLKQAQRKFPEWYEKVVVQGDRSRTPWDIAGKVHGDNPYALYDWWIRQIYDGTAYGHRYFSIMALAIYGIKNGKTFDEVKADALALLPHMNSLNPEEPFTEQDVKVALECYDERYRTFPIKDIEKITGITIKRNKRNGLKQKQHLYLARRRKEDMKAIEIPMKADEGRPSKQQQVRKYRAEHPEASVTEVAKALKMSRTTVYKWWASEPEPTYKIVPFEKTTKIPRQSVNISKDRLEKLKNKHVKPENLQRKTSK